MPRTRLYTILGLILLGVFSRIIPHPPNFTAMNSIALLGMCSLGCYSLSLLTIFAAMFLSDLLFGVHSSLLFVYLSFGVIVAMGSWLQVKNTWVNNIVLSILSSFVFFMISNFGEWYTGSLYAKTLTGLSLCYLSAIPFLATQTLGTIIYSLIIQWSLRIQTRQNLANNRIGTR